MIGRAGSVRAVALAALLCSLTGRRVCVGESGVCDIVCKAAALASPRARPDGAIGNGLRAAADAVSSATRDVDDDNDDGDDVDDDNDNDNDDDGDDDESETSTTAVSMMSGKLSSSASTEAKRGGSSSMPQP